MAGSNEAASESLSRDPHYEHALGIPPEDRQARPPYDGSWRSPKLDTIVAAVGSTAGAVPTPSTWGSPPAGLVAISRSSPCALIQSTIENRNMMITIRNINNKTITTRFLESHRHTGRLSFLSRMLIIGS